MSETRRNQDYLNDILEAMKRIITYTEDLSYENFMRDYKTQDAVIRNLEIIGEATKILSNNIKNKYIQIPWKRMSGMRDKVIHHYFGINYDIVWAVAKEEIPNLIPQIYSIISESHDKGSSSKEGGYKK